MVNYVCRTCSYVSDNEFSFRKLEKVKQVLELFVPEIKTFVGKYSLICDQCYYFLKNVEKFKSKCIETQKKLYSMNIETIKDTHNAVLQSVANDLPVRGQHQRETLSQFNFKTINQPRNKRANEDSPKKATKHSKKDLRSPVMSSVTSESEITLTNLLNTSEKPYFPLQKQSIQKNETTVLNNSAADDLLQLFNNDNTDLRGFREFAVKGVNSTEELEETITSNSIKGNNNEFILNYEDDEEYMTRSDLVSAGILSDDSNKSANAEQQAESESEGDLEIIEINNTRKVEFKISGGSKKSKKSQKPKTLEKVIIDNEPVPASIPITSSVKEEILEDENPGLFQGLNQEPKEINLLVKKEVTSETPEITVKEENIQGIVCNSPSQNQLNIKDSQLTNGDNKANIVTHSKTLQEIYEPQKLYKLCHAYEFFKPRGSWNDEQRFFNKQFADGFYKCRLCNKQYKTSKGLYKHTKKIHVDMKIYHCDHCSFFTLWKSALARHCSVFHTQIFEKNNPTSSRCYHCSFETRSKDELSRHIIERHVYDKFIRCHLCRSRFSDSVSFSKHVDKEHSPLEPLQNSDFCDLCNKVFVDNEAYRKHLENEHKLVLDITEKRSVIKHFCGICRQIFNSNGEYIEHQIKVHAATCN